MSTQNRIWSQAGPVNPPVLVAFLTGFVSLLLGSASPDMRLAIGNFPLSPLVFALLAFVAFRLPIPRVALSASMLIHAGLAGLAVTALQSPDAEYGLLKLANLLLSSLLATLSFAYVIRESGLRNLLRLLVGALGLLMMGGIAYKLPDRLFDRNVHFLLNGPIVFARLMGIGAICAFFAWSTQWRHLAVLVFALAVVITFSNGPVLALILSLTIAYLVFGSGADRRAFLAFTVVGGALIVLAVWRYSLEIDFGRLALLWELATRGFDALDSSFASASSRYVIYSDTIHLITAYPMGVGLGGWDAHVTVGTLRYPHNLFLELFSEAGILAGAIAVVPFLLFVVARSRALLCLGLFLFIAQQVSGDLLDARHLLCVSMLALMERLEAFRLSTAVPGADCLSDG